MKYKEMKNLNPPKNQKSNTFLVKNNLNKLQLKACKKFNIIK